MKRALLLFLLALLSFAFAGDQLRLVKSIPARADLITTDNLGNFYLVKKDVLEKYNADGELLKTYSNKSFGKIDMVDAANPMKVLLYYRNFSQVLFLDNMLSLTGDPVSLEQLGYRQAPVVCTSFNNGLWIYNPQDFELLRLDVNQQKTQGTGNISQLTGTAISPNYLEEYNNHLYLNDPANGILVFDVYGTYSRTIPIHNIPAFEVNNDNIVYIQRGQVMSFNTKTLVQDSFPLPDTSATALRIEKENLYLLGREQVRIYEAH